VERNIADDGKAFNEKAWCLRVGQVWVEGLRSKGSREIEKVKEKKEPPDLLKTFVLS